MSLGASGSTSSSKSTSTNTTPWTGLLSSLSPTLVSELKSVAGGGAIGKGVQAITDQVNQITQTGIQGIKSAFAGSGMGKSTDVLRAISQFTQQQSTGLASTIANFEQTGVQNQLSALAEIISMAQGSGSNVSTGSANQFGFQMGMKLIPGMAP